MMFSAGLAKILFDYSGTMGLRFQRLLSHSRVVGFCLAAVLVAGFGLYPLVSNFLQHGFLPEGGGVQTHWAIFSIWLLIAGLQTFIFALMVRALRVMPPS